MSPLDFALGQNSAPTPAPQPSSASVAGDVELLRDQVRALTDTVKSLQQQVKEQQAALEKANITAVPSLPESSPSPSAPAAAAAAVESKSAAPPPLIPTED